MPACKLSPPSPALQMLILSLLFPSLLYGANNLSIWRTMLPWKAVVLNADKGIANTPNMPTSPEPRSHKSKKPFLAKAIAAIKMTTRRFRKLRRFE